jgi:thioesterase domain-containing protein/acyl carrier protein
MAQESQPISAVSGVREWQLPHGWTRTGDVTHVPPEDSTWLVLPDDIGLGEQISFQLFGAQQRVFEVVPGERFKRITRDRYSVRPGFRQDYEALLRNLLKNTQGPWRVVHLWSMRKDRRRPDELLELGVSSVLSLLEEFNRHGVHKVDFAVVSNTLESPDASLSRLVRDSMLPILEIASQQFPGFVCKSIEVDTSARSVGQIAVQVIREHASAATDPLVAYRGEERWVRTFDHARRSGPVDSAAKGSTRQTEPAGQFPAVAETQMQRGEAPAGLETALIEVWQQLLGAEQISVHDDFFDLGGDSITALRLFNEINARHKVELSLSTIFEARSIRELAALIQQDKARTRLDTPVSAPSPALVGIQPEGSRPRIHVISGLGGNVIKFQQLAFYLGEDQPIFGLLPRGLDGKEPFFTSIEEMASYYVNAIQGAQPRGPYNLIGYSFGGLAAFEVARQLVALGCEVSFLGLLDTAEPQYLERVQKSLPVADRYRVYKEYLETFTTGEGLARLRNRIARKLSGLTYRLYRARSRSIPRQLANIEDVNMLAAIQYKPGPYPGKLTLFRSTERHVSEGTERLLGWTGLVREIEVIDIGSNHFNILKEPHVRVLAEKIKACLAADRPAKSLHPELSHR